MLRIFAWEWIQNIALTLPVIYAVNFWSQDLRAKALFTVSLGAALAASVGHYTEPLITGLPRGSLLGLITSIIIFVAASATFTIYLGKTERSVLNKTDVVLVVVIAVLVTAGQASVNDGGISAGAFALHGMAMCVAVALGLFLMRRIKPASQLGLLAKCLLVALAVTMVMVTDYVRYLLPPDEVRSALDDQGIVCVELRTESAHKYLAVVGAPEGLGVQ